MCSNQRHPRLGDADKGKPATRILGRVKGDTGAELLALATTASSLMCRRKIESARNAGSQNEITLAGHFGEPCL